MAGRFSVEAVFKAVDRITAPVSRMQNRVGKFTRSMGNNFHKLNRKVDRFASGVKKGAVAVSAALLISSAAMANVIETGAGFEQTLVTAAAKFPGEIRRGSAAFAELETAARKTGATTEFTARQSAQALNFMAMAGFNAEQSITALPGIVDLATASSTDLATASDIATDALGAFGLMSKDTSQLQTNLSRVGDVLLKTSVTANASVEQLFESMKKAAPIATAAGVNIETVSALMGVMANSGIKAEKAGTAVTNMFLNLTSPAGKAQKILKRLQLQVLETDGSLRDVPSIIDDLGKSMSKFSDPKKLAILEGLFGREGLAGMATVVSGGGDALRAYRKELLNASGSQKKMANIIRDTVQNKLNGLTSAIEGVKISLFSMSRGPLADTVDKMTEWVRANEDLIATNIGGFINNLIDNFESIVTWIKRIGIALAVFFVLASVLKTLALILTVVNLVMAANPITLIVIGVLLLIAAVAAAIYWFDELYQAFLDSSKGMDALITGVALMTGPIGWLIGAALLIVKYWEPIKEFFRDLWDGVVSMFDAAIEKIMSVVDRVKNAAAGIVNTISSIGKGVGSFFGFGGEVTAGQGAAAAPQMVSPQDRVANSINEQRTTSTSEVTIRDESGRAEVTAGRMGPGLTLLNTGAM